MFAPFDGAFAEIKPKDLNGLVAEGQEKGQESTLYKILAHHVSECRPTPRQWSASTRPWPATR